MNTGEQPVAKKTAIEDRLRRIERMMRYQVFFDLGLYLVGGASALSIYATTLDDGTISIVTYLIVSTMLVFGLLAIALHFKFSGPIRVMMKKEENL